MPTCASAKREAGYQEVNTPQVMDRELWVKSGHIENFGENMFFTKTPDERVFALKPMNCPGHIQVFKQGLRSYRELPLRFAEFGEVNRYEPSGALHGLMRVRCLHPGRRACILHAGANHRRVGQDHRVDLEHLPRTFGFTDVRIKFSDRPRQAGRVG